MQPRPGFWDRPEKAPLSLKKLVKNGYMHLTTPEKAVGIIEGGIQSHDFAKRIGRPLSEGFGTPIESKDTQRLVSVYKLPMRVTLAGPSSMIGFVVSLPRKDILEPRYLSWNEEKRVLRRIPPRNIRAIIIGKPTPHYAEILEAAKKAGIPVYRNPISDGKGLRLWPERQKKWFDQFGQMKIWLKNRLAKQT